MDLYDIAREVTDDVMGQGTYARLNGTNPDPNVRRAVEDSKANCEHDYCDFTEGDAETARSVCVNCGHERDPA